MSNLSKYLRVVNRDTGILPQLVAERCVHAHIADASCRACLDNCPRDAWVLDEEQLGIDANRCDGCGLCVAACPQGAVLTELLPELKQAPNAPLAMFACERGEAKPGTGVIPCLHAIGLAQLLTLYRQGVHTIIIHSGDCSACPRGSSPRLDKLITCLNTLLVSRRLQKIEYHSAGASAWSDMNSDLPPLSTVESSNRRRFLKRLMQKAIDAQPASHPGKQADVSSFVPPGNILPMQSGRQMVPFLPGIDPKRCNGCSACINLCPNDALEFVKEAVAYHIQPDRCTGCGLCEDVCDQNAVTIETWAIPDTLDIPLRSARCGDCGTPYLMSTANPGTAGLCRICNGHRHLQNLYQVYD